MSRLIPLEARDEWTAALTDVPHAYAHTWECCNAMAASSGYRTYLYCFESSSNRVVCPVSERSIEEYVDVVTPYGFSGFVGTGPSSELAEEWTLFAESMGWVCAYIVLNPVLTDRTYFAGEAKRHRTVYVLDLSLGEDRLFSRLSTNRRRQVRKAAQQRWTFVHDGERLGEFFVRTYPDFMARHAATRVYELSEISLRAVTASSQVLMFGVEEAEQIVAVSVFGATRYCGDFLYNVSLPGAEHHSAALIWEGVRELIARGVPILNLGGGVTEGDSLAAFKERFRGESRALESVQQIYRPDVYAALCKRAGASGDQAGYFPAYRSGSQQ